jgi:threonine dehydratase
MSITLHDILEAATRIRPIAKVTPVFSSRTFDECAGVRTVFKCENFQTGGAFKIRGAANRIFSLTGEDRARGVVAFSSGNHAQAVAIASKQAGVRAVIAMPTDAPKSKLDATRGYGAEVVLYDRMKEDREAFAAKIAEETGGVIVPPFDHPLIMAGQGTVALELLEQADVDAIVTPVGGGGLLSGCAVAAGPNVRVFGAEPERANDTWQSFRKGERVTIAPPDTIADGLRPPAPGKVTFPVIRELVEDIVLVTEDEIREAVRFLLLRLKILVEPSGAVPAAAVLYGKLPAGVRSAGVVLSGGNVDPDALATILG